MRWRRAADLGLAAALAVALAGTGWALARAGRAGPRVEPEAALAALPVRLGPYQQPRQPSRADADVSRSLRRMAART
jgi:hypothetical protein